MYRVWSIKISNWIEKISNHCFTACSWLKLVHDWIPRRKRSLDHRHSVKVFSESAFQSCERFTSWYLKVELSWKGSMKWCSANADWNSRHLILISSINTGTDRLWSTNVKAWDHVWEVDQFDMFDGYFCCWLFRGSIRQVRRLLLPFRWCVWIRPVSKSSGAGPVFITPSKWHFWAIPSSRTVFSSFSRSWSRSFALQIVPITDTSDYFFETTGKWKLSSSSMSWQTPVSEHRTSGANITRNGIDSDTARSREFDTVTWPILSGNQKLTARNQWRWGPIWMTLSDDCIAIWNDFTIWKCENSRDSPYTRPNNNCEYQSHWSEIWGTIFDCCGQRFLLPIKQKILSVLNPEHSATILSAFELLTNPIRSRSDEDEFQEEWIRISEYLNSQSRSFLILSEGQLVHEDLSKIFTETSRKIERFLSANAYRTRDCFWWFWFVAELNGINEIDFRFLKEWSYIIDCVRISCASSRIDRT
jgi:hypothetical protein